MAFQAVPRGIEVKLVGIQAGQPIINVFHVDNQATVTPTDLQEVTVIFDNWWKDFIRGGISSGYTLTQIVATDISIPNGAQEILVPDAPNTGAVTSEATAANAALVISWRTAQTGRSFRGRTYFGAIPQDALNGPTTFDSTYAAGFAVGGAELLEALEAGGRFLAVLSRYAGGVLRVVGLLTEIITVIVNLQVDSSRKRLAN